MSNLARLRLGSANIRGGSASLEAVFSSPASGRARRLEACEYLNPADPCASRRLLLFIRGGGSSPSQLRGRHGRRRAMEHGVEDQLECRARLGAEINLAAVGHDVAFADAER